MPFSFFERMLEVKTIKSLQCSYTLAKNQNKQQTHTKKKIDSSLKLVREAQTFLELPLGNYCCSAQQDRDTCMGGPV